MKTLLINWKGHTKTKRTSNLCHIVYEYDTNYKLHNLQFISKFSKQETWSSIHLHQFFINSSSTSYDLMHFTLSHSCTKITCANTNFMKLTSLNWIDEARSIEKLEKFLHTNTYTSKSTQACIHFTYAHAPLSLMWFNFQLFIQLVVLLRSSGCSISYLMSNARHIHFYSILLLFIPHWIHQIEVVSMLFWKR